MSISLAKDRAADPPGGDQAVVAAPSPVQPTAAVTATIHYGDHNLALNAPKPGPPDFWLSVGGALLGTARSPNWEVFDMPIRTDPWPAGTPCWVDLSVPDLTAAKEFYGAVFGWTFLDSGAEFGNYQICQVDGRAAAAIGPCQAEGQPTAWTVYLASDDADGTAKLIADNGGTVLAEPFDIPGNGRMCIAQDPLGATFGVWQAAGTHGVEIYMEPGSLVWTDARLPDPDTGRTFYAAVFGYRYEPIEGAPPDYTSIHFDGARDGEPVGGIGGMMGAPEGTPPHWLAYFMVPDADVATASARAAGGTILAEPFDTPYGRMAGITDPHGASFVVVGTIPST
jgi:predicted enzyme related to lactoylglutathione lyase